MNEGAGALDTGMGRGEAFALPAREVRRCTPVFPRAARPCPYQANGSPYGRPSSQGEPFARRRMAVDGDRRKPCPYTSTLTASPRTVRYAAGPAVTCWHAAQKVSGGPLLHFDA